MNFYTFATLEEVEILYQNHYTGALLTYNVDLGDYFTRIARVIDEKKDFKYMVAMRPYAMSPQYLSMIINSMNIISKNKVQINFITGWPTENEKNFGGILGTVNDLSSKIERSNYLIEYIENVENLKRKVIDYYVTTTNEFVFDTASKFNSKMIISYDQYKNNKYNLNNKKIMISMSPLLRKTKEELKDIDRSTAINDSAKFTYEEFYFFIKELESNGIDEVMICEWNKKEKKRINKAVKEYKEKENK